VIVRRIAFIPALVMAFACVSVQSGYSLGAADAGTTKNVAAGSELRLVLPGDLDWTLESTNTSALALKSSQLGNVGGSSVRTWLFNVKQAGDYVVRATGEAPCRKSAPPCATPALHYEFNIRAR
jgi:hypothetical protein